MDILGKIGKKIEFFESKCIDFKVKIIFTNTIVQSIYFILEFGLNNELKSERWRFGAEDLIDCVEN